MPVSSLRLLTGTATPPVGSDPPIAQLLRSNNCADGEVWRTSGPPGGVWGGSPNSINPVANSMGNTVTPFDTLLHDVREHTRTITADSRAVTPGSVFVAVPGAQSDGAAYIPAPATMAAGM